MASKTQTSSSNSSSSSPSNSSSNFSSSKRIVLVTGDKGGTGKSTFARGLLDIYRFRGIDCQAYDGDKRNALLYRHYKNLQPGVERIDFFTRGGADALLDNLESSQPQVVLVDLPAQSGEAFENYETEMGLFADAGEMGYQVTTASVISRGADSVNALRLLMQYCGESVDYLAIKNLFYGESEKFSRFDESKTRKEFQSQGGVEIVMPDLFDATYDAIDSKSNTFRDAAKSRELSLSNRSRVHSWLKRLEGEADQAGELLGLGGSSSSNEQQ